MATFQLKNFVSIVASMINHARATQKVITDFNIGSVFRTLLESCATEIDQLYQQLFNGIMQAIPVATYNSFNFPLLPAQVASGLITIVCTNQLVPVTYPAGSVFTSQAAQTSYVSTADVIVAAGATLANIPVAATTAGALGNLAAGAVFTLASAPAGFVSASITTSISNGEDQETEDQRARRFVSYVTTLSRATVAALQYGATTASILDSNGNVIEQVKTVSVVEINLLSLSLNANIPPVNIYVHNGVGSTSAALVAQALKVLTGYVDASGTRIPGWKAAGVPITVQAATEIGIPVTATIYVATGYQVAAAQVAIQSAIQAYILALPIGGTFIYSQAVALAMAIPGVTDIVFGTPTADITSTNTQKLMPGAFGFISPAVGSSFGSATAQAFH